MLNRVSLSVDEAAKAAGIGQTKLREEIAAKHLIARKLARLIRQRAAERLASVV
jgi:hypothetical protein